MRPKNRDKEKKQDEGKERQRYLSVPEEGLEFVRERYETACRLIEEYQQKLKHPEDDFAKGKPRKC